MTNEEAFSALQRGLSAAGIKAGSVRRGDDGSVSEVELVTDGVHHIIHMAEIESLASVENVIFEAAYHADAHRHYVAALKGNTNVR